MARDPNEQEIEDKINALCDRTYGNHALNNLKALFQSYDDDSNGGLGEKELERLLKDADIGNWLTRSSWVDGIFEKLDRSPQNGIITWDEYLAVSSVSKEDIEKSKAPPPSPPVTQPPATPPASPPVKPPAVDDAWGKSTYVSYENCDTATGLCLSPVAPSSKLPVLLVGVALLAGVSLGR